MECAYDDDGDPTDNEGLFSIRNEQFYTRTMHAPTPDPTAVEVQWTDGVHGRTLKV